MNSIAKNLKASGNKNKTDKMRAKLKDITTSVH
jgi:hypothetical protein